MIGSTGKDGKRCYFFATVPDFGDFTTARLLYRIYPNDCMHRDVSPANPGKLCLKAFFGGINHYRAFFAKEDFLYLDEAEEATLIDVPGVELINLALAMECDAIGRFFSHNSMLCKRRVRRSC